MVDRIKYAGPGDDDLKVWKVTYVDGSIGYVEAYTLASAVSFLAGDKPVVKVEFDLCLHDNDWWESVPQAADCPFSEWS
jgi:hypothetical protein